VSLLVPDGVATVALEGAPGQVVIRRLEGRERRVVTWDMPEEREITMVLRGKESQNLPGEPA